MFTSDTLKNLKKICYHLWIVDCRAQLSKMHRNWYQSWKTWILSQTAARKLALALSTAPLAFLGRSRDQDFAFSTDHWWPEPAQLGILRFLLCTPSSVAVLSPAPSICSQGVVLWCTDQLGSGITELWGRLWKELIELPCLLQFLNNFLALLANLKG